MTDLPPTDPFGSGDPGGDLPLADALHTAGDEWTPDSTAARGALFAGRTGSERVDLLTDGSAVSPRPRGRRRLGGAPALAAAAVIAVAASIVAVPLLTSGSGGSRVLDAAGAGQGGDSPAAAAASCVAPTPLNGKLGVPCGDCGGAAPPPIPSPAGSLEPPPKPGADGRTGGGVGPGPTPPGLRDMPLPLLPGAGVQTSATSSDGPGVLRSVGPPVTADAPTGAAGPGIVGPPPDGTFSCTPLGCAKGLTAGAPSRRGEPGPPAPASPAAVPPPSKPGGSVAPHELPRALPQPDCLPPPCQPPPHPGLAEPSGRGSGDSGTPACVSCDPVIPCVALSPCPLPQPPDALYNPCALVAQGPTACSPPPPPLPPGVDYACATPKLVRPGAGSPSTPPGPPLLHATAGSVTVTEQDNGATVVLAPGEHLIMKLRPPWVPPQSSNPLVLAADPARNTVFTAVADGKAIVSAETHFACQPECLPPTVLFQVPVLVEG